MTNNLHDDLHSLGDVERAVEREEQNTNILRQQERALKAQAHKIQNAAFTPGAGGSPSAFLAHLKKVLPDFLIPSNIGKLNQNSWGFWEAVDFDFGDDPTLQPGAIRQTQSYFVTADSGFLMLALSWNPESMTTSGLLGPWNVEVRDRQSSRVFNSGPIPLQILGRRGLPTVFPIPMYFNPSAYVEFTMDTHAIAPAPYQQTQGSGKHQIMCYGFRIRPEADPYQVLSMIYEGV